MNQKIKCHVSSCKFQNDNSCMLKEILIGAIENPKQVKENDETLCKSFECDKK